MKLSKHIFKVGIFTGISRVFGFVRDILIARVLGVGRLSDIFLAAFKLPNLFRDLLGEGALSVVFVPMFSEYKDDKSAAQKFASNVFSWFMLILLGITILGLVLMPLIIWILAPGFAADPGKMELTVLISRIMFFYLIFICGSAFLGSILNSYSDFAIAAAMPVLFNIFMIAGLLFAFYYAPTFAIYIAAVTVVISGIAQMAILWRRLRARKFGLRLVRPRWNAAIKTFFKRIGVGIAGSGFYQLNIIIGALVASFQAGAVSWIYFSDRIVQLPFAIIGLAMGTVILTSISDAIQSKNMRSVHIQQNSVLRNSIMWTLPCMIGLIILAVPIITVLFEHGNWTHESTLRVAVAIMIQSLVLLPMTTSQIYMKTLYAARDVKTPVRTSVISLVVSTGLYIGLMGIVGYLAVPIGTVVGGYTKNYLMRRACVKRGLYKSLPASRKAIAMFAVLAMVMGAVLWFGREYVTGIFTLAGLIAIAGIIYMPAAFMLNRRIK